MSAQNGHVEVVALLIDAGAALDRPLRADRASPLYIAAQNGHLDVVRLLVGRGADPNARRLGGFSPFWKACDRGHKAIVELLLLLSDRVDVSARADNGVSPAQAAKKVRECDQTDPTTRAPRCQHLPSPDVCAYRACPPLLVRLQLTILPIISPMFVVQAGHRSVYNMVQAEKAQARKRKKRAGRAGVEGGSRVGEGSGGVGAGVGAGRDAEGFGKRGLDELPAIEEEEPGADAIEAQQQQRGTDAATATAVPTPASPVSSAKAALAPATRTPSGAVSASSLALVPSGEVGNAERTLVDPAVTALATTKEAWTWEAYFHHTASWTHDIGNCAREHARDWDSDIEDGGGDEIDGDSDRSGGDSSGSDDSDDGGGGTFGWSFSLGVPPPEERVTLPKRTSTEPRKRHRCSWWRWKRKAGLNIQRAIGTKVSLRERIPVPAFATLDIL